MTITRSIEIADLDLASTFTISLDVLGQTVEGWTINGEISEDYFEWCENFIAVHPVYGTVRGFREGNEVTGESDEAIDAFLAVFTPYIGTFDYQDI